MKPFYSMNPDLSVPSFIFDAQRPVGTKQNSSFPLFLWCGKSACILSITMKLLDIALGLIINFHESSRARACPTPRQVQGYAPRPGPGIGGIWLYPRSTVATLL
jgi:hypothetical protein